jgi:hypothetical protein
VFDLANRLRDLPERQGEPPWPGHEYVKGWSVFGLPFDSGHVLALRVFPENDFSPYRTLWHRDPQGRRSIYVDGPSADTACPRYYGAACDHVGHAQIQLAWTGPASLRVTMDQPALEWTLTARQTPLLRAMKAISPRLPRSTWRSPMPQRMYFIDETTAVLDGVDLGRATHVHPNPHIGGVPLPARGVLAIGQGAWQIPDPGGTT